MPAVASALCAYALIAPHSTVVTACSANRAARCAGVNPPSSIDPARSAPSARTS